MKATHLAVFIAAHVTLFAVPAFADECSPSSIGEYGAAASVSASQDAQSMHAMTAKTVKHDSPDVGGADAYKTQSGKRDRRDDSIDGWFRGG
ncbi:hypothetical protein AWB75_02179 [Caballeronia catudaia]|uniref:Uncharacterized protein n=1 Tax=Caballeronia catudaia TaxID=1777136 RepID=A0A158AHA4_9BURK|nr:hypothetical protein [Caballeronia catudaia]SAK57095.1 hypothetical protein AWB75_02179 [Caballeronia catudaia]